MTKKISTIPPKPISPVPPPAHADAWVMGSPTASASTAAPVEAASPVSAPAPERKEALKRFTIDVPESLHRRIKTWCAVNGVNMANEVRELLEKRFPA